MKPQHTIGQYKKILARPGFCNLVTQFRRVFHHTISKMTEQKIKMFINILDIFIFIILFGVSVFSNWEIFQKYQSQDSTFKKVQVPISTLPSISICFLPYNENNLKYGTDFNISKYNNNNDYLADSSKQFILQEGENPDVKVIFNILKTGKTL